MADPTIQTFCCQHTNRTDLAIVVMQEFDSNTYNRVCMVSSVMGILGAIYQILPRQESNNPPHRWRSFSSSRGRQIIIWLALADLFASLGVFIRSALWMKFKGILSMENGTSSILFCILSSAWTQYFYMSTWIWTLCYAVDMKLLLNEKPGHPSRYHAFAWIVPAVLTTFGLTILYIPNADCHGLTSLSTAIVRILPNYFATYVLLTLVMICNPILYMASTKHLQTMVSVSLAQMTGRERKLVQRIKFRFALTNLVYYVCWLPNLINGILLWTLWFRLPVNTVISFWYIMAVTNPLQAFFNAFVYRKWGKREKLNLCYIIKRNNTNVTESSPLLNLECACQSRTSINGSSSS